MIKPVNNKLIIFNNILDDTLIVKSIPTFYMLLIEIDKAMRYAIL